jgi:hypothetical protein
MTPTLNSDTRFRISVAQSVLANANSSQAAKDAANAVLVAYLTSTPSATQV